jgi:hypothetical protein
MAEEDFTQDQCSGDVMVVNRYEEPGRDLSLTEADQLVSSGQAVRITRGRTTPGSWSQPLNIVSSPDGWVRWY